MKKYKKQIIIASSIIATLAIFNYFLVILPERRERAAEIQRELKIRDLKTFYKLCEINAEEEYAQDWANQCNVKGEGSDCFLSTVSAENVNKRFKDKKDRCFDNYKLELNLIK